MKNIYEVFELNTIKNEIIQYSCCEKSRHQILNLTMYQTKVALIEELSHLNEVMKYTIKYRNIKITPHKDLSKMFAIIGKGGLGNVDFFYQVACYLDNAKSLKEEVIKDEEFPFLNNLIRQLDDLENLKYKIEKTLTKDLQIDDKASTLLFQIRKEIKGEISNQNKIIASLMNKYKDYLNDERVALRDANFALPIKATYKNRVDGIVIDESESGLTYFIEPSEIIASNNKITRLKEKEKQEINRIIEELTLHCYNNLSILIDDENAICYLDFLLAKAQYGLSIDGCVPSINDDQIISLKGAIHPLIPKNKVVANTFLLNQQKIMLISGPNAGGKTVALKVIGLAIIMGEMGLMIPCKEGSFSFIEQVFVDMGDNQSISDNLSTFSGHIKNLQEITSQVNNNSLVILDELGSGTSPLDGEALGIGIIKYLHKVGCFALLTSHFDGLKNYALESSYILNASMTFDEEKIAPTYKIRLGVAGKSYGIEMASRMNLKDEILQDAKAYLEGKITSNKELTLSLLNKKLEENEIIKENLLAEQEKLVQKEQLLEQERKSLNNLKTQMKQNAEVEVEKLIAEAKDKIDAIYQDYQTKNEIKMHEVIKSKKDLDALLSLDEEEYVSPYVPQINDYVRDETFNVTGSVIRLKGDNAIILTSQGLTLTCKINDLTKISSKAPKEKKQFTPSYKLEKKVPLECNIVGFHIEEGLREVDKYLDDAITAHYKEVRIIHGSGTGKLRSAVQEYLKKRKDVKSFRLGGLGEGGVGATIVYF